MDRSELIALLRKYASAEEKTTAGGTVKLGHVPIVAPLAYLHSVHAPLTAEELSELEEELPTRIPRQYAEFLSQANGVELFVATIGLFGWRTSYARVVDQEEPFSITDANGVERPGWLSVDSLIIGYYQQDGSHIVMGRDRDEIACISPDGKALRRAWRDIDAFLVAEVTRLGHLLAPEYSGLRFDSDVETLPVAVSSSDGSSEPAADHQWWRRARWWHGFL